MIDFVVSLVEVHVDSGGSRSSESNLERLCHVIVSLQNMESWNVEINLLLVDCTVEFVVRVERRNVTIFFRSKLSFHCVCIWAVSLIRLLCSILSLLNTCVFRHIIKFPWSIWRTEFFVETFIIDLMGTGRFTSDNKHTCMSSRFPDRSQIGLGFGWVSWENVACWTSPQDCRSILPTGCCSIVEPNSSFFWSNRDRVVMRSLVVVEETCMISHLRLLQSSISQLLECNKLEVFFEG